MVGARLGLASLRALFDLETESNLKLVKPSFAGDEVLALTQLHSPFLHHLCRHFDVLVATLPVPLVEPHFHLWVLRLPAASFLAQVADLEPALQ